MIAEAFYEAMNAIAARVPERPLPQGLVEVETEKWRLALNTTGDVLEWEGEGCGASVPPYTIAAVHKEVIQMAMFDAGGGTIGGGMTEDQFIDEMKAAQQEAA